MNPTFYFIDMELCDFNLDVYIRRNFPQHLRGRVRQFLEVEKLTVEEKRGQILGVLRDIIAGVEYIHSEGEIHRDLKPQNGNPLPCSFFSVYFASELTLD